MPLTSMRVTSCRSNFDRQLVTLIDVKGIQNTALHSELPSNDFNNAHYRELDRRVVDNTEDLALFYDSVCLGNHNSAVAREDS